MEDGGIGHSVGEGGGVEGAAKQIPALLLNIHETVTTCVVSLIRMHTYI